jgi:GH43 family beta-xylosidase
MGTIKCKTCPGTWTVSTTKTEKVIAENHTYLHPGHRTYTLWEEPEQDTTVS